MLQDSLVTGTPKVPFPTDGSSTSTPSLVHEWFEMWDYVGGLRFRGFVAGHEDGKSVFVFFDDVVIGKDLKPGYVMARRVSRVQGSH